MRREEVVDLRFDQGSETKLLQGHFFRVAGPIGFVIIMLAALLAIIAFSHFSNRRDALALSNEVLAALERRIAGELEAFLKPIDDTVRLTVSFLENTTFDIHNRDALEPLAFRVLDNLSQVANFDLADTKGNFLMIARQRDGSLHTKFIDRSPGPSKSTWIRRDTDGKVVDEETTVDDAFDPRNRPWFSGAVNRQEPYWSDFYVFFTSQTHGTTISLPIMGDNDERLGVFGLDIELKAISTFLETLKIGENGEAIIIDEEGYIVAHPDIDKMIKKDGDIFKPILVEELGNPVLSRAYNRFRIEGHGHRDLTVDGKRYLSSAFLMPQKTGLDLSVIIFVPEEDFVGFVARNNRNILLISAVILILAAVLAGLLVIKSLQSERSAQKVLERQHKLEAQSRAFSELSSKAAVFGPKDTESYRELTEIVTHAINLRRTSLWRFDEKDQMACVDSYDIESSGHTQGTVLVRPDFSSLLDLLQNGEDISTADAEEDSHLTELFQGYLQPLGCRSLLAVPMRYHELTVGSLWFERERMRHNWSEEELSFAHAVANMLALRFSAEQKSMSTPAKLPEDSAAAEDSVISGAVNATVFSDMQTEDQAAETQPADGQKTPVAAGPSSRLSSFLDRLAAGNIVPDQTSADLITDATVLALRFTDAISLAGQVRENQSITTLDLMVAHLEKVAAAQGIEYIKLMGEEIICAAGIDSDATDHARRIADLALNLQHHYVDLFASLNAPFEFRIGIDTGACMGCEVGGEQKTYNIWGESVRFASKMAESGTAGGIQVSQTTYQRLRANYLFQMRGRYYLPHVGEIFTYLLTGHI